MTKIDDALVTFSLDNAKETLEAYLHHEPGPVVVLPLVRSTFVVGFDMGMSFALEYPEEAKAIAARVAETVELNDDDKAQRTKLFAPLVQAVIEDQS